MLNKSAKYYKLRAIMQVAIDAHREPKYKQDFSRYVNVSGIEMLCKYHEFSNTTIIGFGGTDEILDWRNNLLFTPYEHSLGFKIHRGYFRAFSHLVPYLYEITFIRKSEKLYIAGFSQGAALAQVALLYLKAFQIPTEVFIAGSPLIGDVNFNNLISYPNLFRSYFFRNDPVHYLPFCFGYEHPKENIDLGWKFALNPHNLHLYKKAIIDYEIMPDS